MSKEMDILNIILKDIKKEFMSAINQHDKLNSAHEAYSVILEELDELWDEIKKRKENRDVSLMKNEAIQIAAMCIRFIYDVIEKEQIK